MIVKRPRYYSKMSNAKREFFGPVPTVCRLQSTLVDLPASIATSVATGPQPHGCRLGPLLPYVVGGRLLAPISCSVPPTRAGELGFHNLGGLRSIRPAYACGGASERYVEAN